MIMGGQFNLVYRGRTLEWEKREVPKKREKETKKKKERSLELH